MSKPKYYGMPEPPTQSENRARDKQVSKYIKTHHSRLSTVSGIPTAPTPKPKTGNTSRRQSALTGFALSLGLAGAISSNRPSLTNAPARKGKKGGK